MKYDFVAIEQRWQQYWVRNRTFRTPNPGQQGFDPSKPKYYVLDMFPYPSGVGLHVGHPLGYIATDIVARFKRMTGHNVLHPMGYDAFGLPAEQFAVEHGVHPRITTEKNIENMTRQLKQLGLSYDWDRCLSTTDPGYYRWTQWIFLQLHGSWFDPVCLQARPIAELEQRLQSEAAYVGLDGELIDAAETEGLDAITGAPIGARKWHELSTEEQQQFLDDRRLAYLDEVPVNWCPALGTVLANEEVTNEGRSERGNHPVFKRPLKQWMLRITAYAKRLIDDLDRVDWPEPIKIMQRNWIGQSEGASVRFVIESTQEDPGDEYDDESITVFTTRPDTLFGATYMVLAPEHPLVETITSDKQKAEVSRYCREASAKADVDRQAETKEKTGVFTGAYAINPVNQDRVPIWIADYVMMGYGTGAIMAVPAHDDRDFEFAQKYNLPIRDVVYTPPLAAVGAFGRRFELDPFDEGHAHRLLTDYIGFCINRPGMDYDEAWKVINSRRGGDDIGGPGISSRGTISTIWRDAVNGLMKNDLRQLLDSAKHGSLIKFLGAAVTEPGVNVHSANDEVSLEGLTTRDAKRTIVRWLASKGLGRPTIQYKLRDWLFSRQRYWGEPFPILHGPNGRAVVLDESQLPVELPEMEDFKPTGNDDPDAPPQPPLTRASDSWKYAEHDGVNYLRELNTMPQWAGSCWYYLRFCDPDNSDQLVSQEAERYWMGDGHQEQSGGVDLYVGGAEHAVLHLLYARFWHKVLYDLGHVGTPEPFARLFNQGYIQAHAYTDARGVYVPAEEIEEEDGRFFYKGEPVKQEFGKMGKSLKNAVTPDEICEEYGCDTLRLYEMYLGPLDQSKVWRTRDIVGAHRFLQRLWRNFVAEDGRLTINDDPPTDELRRRLHRTIKKVTDDVQRLSINTAIAALIELNNELVSLASIPREVAQTLVLLLSPMAPHICEELWSRIGHEQTLAYEPWPTHDPDLLVEGTIEYPIQINGKIKGRITVPVDANDGQIEDAALTHDQIKNLIADRTVKKVIVVRGRMVNIVITT